MTPDSTRRAGSAAGDRRAVRAAAQRRFDTLPADHLNFPAVDEARMFASDVLRADGKFYAFIGRDGQLIVKLPQHQGAHLIGAGSAASVRVGDRTMREWVGIPMPSAADPADLWSRLLADARRRVAALTAPPTGAT
ncbi:MAG: hypothetical protein ACYDAQ_00110 [Mycobacteriales bacterium]